MSSPFRDHEPITIEQFNGLWINGDSDAVPIDHFTDCNNIIYLNEGFRTRVGIFPFRGIKNPVRIFTYVMQTGQSILVLTEGGDIYHVISETLSYGPILSIPEMEDFKVVSIAGRAYITPFYTDDSGDINYQRGLEDEVVYVYAGDGTAARPAAGSKPSGTLVAANSATPGNVEAGYHVFGVAYETDTGFITKDAGFVSLLATGGFKVDLSSIPTSPESFVVARRIVATKAIPASQFTGDLTGYEFFFVPDGRIADNTTTVLVTNFFDSELLDSADYLLDQLEEIPAGADISTYHNRMVVSATFDDISLQYVSKAGEPESIDSVDGLIIIPLDGNPITRAQEFRDVLYTYKKTRTFGINDNGDVPSSWPVVVIDQGIGASVHGIALVLDSGGVNLDYLLVVDYSGILVFNGTYNRPELSWKIKDYWLDFDRNDFGNIQIMNDSLQQRLYLTIPAGLMLFGDYTNGLGWREIKWSKWQFDVDIASIALYDTNNLLLASNQIPGFIPS